MFADSFRVMTVTVNFGTDEVYTKKDGRQKAEERKFLSSFRVLSSVFCLSSFVFRLSPADSR
jgi:hypothetical protein